MQKRKNGKGSRALAGAGLGALAAVTCGVVGFAGHAQAASINVALADEFTTTTTGNTGNQGINPVSYTPPTVTIPYATDGTVTATYDAADITDTGTAWNSLEGVSTAPTTSNPSLTAQLPVLYEQNLPLVDSSGASTGVTLNVSVLEGPGKSDSIHPNGSNAGAAGTDGLVPNPANSTSTTGGLVDGYAGTGASHKELMNPSWISNGVSDGFLFTLNGLSAGVYNLYVYGAGSAAGMGGTFSASDTSGNLTGSSVTTNSSASGWHRSVFDATSLDPAPELGLSWNLLQVTVGPSGTLSFVENNSGDNIKGAMNGFQLDGVVPEPASLAMLGLGSLSLLGRRRSRKV